MFNRSPRSPHLSPSRRVRATPALLAAVLVAAACTNSKSTPGGTVVPREQSRQFRAIAGVSMGAFGAMNTGTRRHDIFGVIGALGGPVDSMQLLRHLWRDNLEVKAQGGVPRGNGEDFTFDHLPPYPGRDTRFKMARDLFIAFGNPFLHHPDPTRTYFAVDAEPAAVLLDDEFGAFTLPVAAGGFLEGGDLNRDGVRQPDELAPMTTIDVLLLAGGSLSKIAGRGGMLVGERAILDLDADGVIDVGDGLVINYAEPFDDPNGNLIHEPLLGEGFADFGLDGVAGTADFGENNGQFDYDPDRARWLLEDPLSRLAARTTDEIASQRFYLDVGLRDEFAFLTHYDHLVALLTSKGIPVAVRDGFTGGCGSLPSFTEPFQLVRYDGGHVGIPEADDIVGQLRSGDFCSDTLLVWQRLRSLFGFLNQSFPDGDFGAGGLRLIGSVASYDLPSPELTPAGAQTVMRNVVVYRPPAHFNTDRRFPIVYFLGGYGQKPQDFERIGLLLDLLIVTGELQNAYFAFIPGEGGWTGSFYVDHVVPDVQVPGLTTITTGRHESSFLNDLLPRIEDEILQARIRRP